VNGLLVPLAERVKRGTKCHETEAKILNTLL